ncbi:MAG: methylenetetrahydrofolate reductase [Defluviitaleaceae bacterium]|nr:methylenetetrahydrofolate reductase [Defluviitaleaceae bacterium]
MNIRDLYRQGPVFSCEVFPPKKGGDFDAMYDTLARISKLSPAFISVTCGVDGKSKTVEIADHIQKQHGIPSMAHLTCLTATQPDIINTLESMRQCGVENVLALRGDIPQDGNLSPSPQYRYAEDLVRDLRTRNNNLCIGAACYPEGHIECDDIFADIERLRRKQDAGADFFVSQLFFENDMFYRFLERTRRAGVTNPISAGIMPILSRAQIQRMIFLCGASLPSSIIKILNKYEHDPETLGAAGIEYACAQARDLAEHGADGIHIYTMNRPQIAEACAKALGHA